MLYTHINAYNVRTYLICVAIIEDSGYSLHFQGLLFKAFTRGLFFEKITSTFDFLKFNCVKCLSISLYFYIIVIRFY